MKYCLGVDLGKENDPGALTILKMHEQFQEVDITIPSYGVRKEKRKIINELHLIYITEVPLGTSYPKFVEKIKMIINNPKWVGQISTVVDRTGLGIPVVDMMIEAGINPVGVMITNGKEMNAAKDHYNVPKVDLITALLTAMQMKRFKMPLPDSVKPDMRKYIMKFKEELTEFKMKVNNRTKQIAYEAATEAVHDDLVISTALAVWWMNMIYGASPESDITKGGDKYPDYQKRKKNPKKTRYTP